MPTRTDEARSAARGALALGVLQSVGRVLALGFVVTTARAVAPDDFGRYSTVAAVLLIVGFVSDLGTTSATTKLVSTGTDADRLLSDSLFACLCLGLAAWAAGVVGVGAFYSPLLAADFAILGASLPVDACLTTIIGALDGSGAIARRAVVSFLRVGLGAVVAAVLVLATGSIRWTMAGLVAGPAVGLVVAAVFARRLGIWRGRVRLDPRRGGPLIAAALPYAVVSGLSVVTARVDVVVVSIVASRATTAAYDVAVRVLEGPLFIINVLSGPMLYLFSRRLAARDIDGAQRAYDQVVRLFFVCGMGISMILTTLAAPLVATFFGSSYDEADLVLAIFGAQLWLMFVCGLQGMLLAAMPRMRRVVGLIVLVNLVQSAVQVAFIVAAGIVGGAVSYSVGTLFTMVAGAFFLRRETGVRTLRLPPVGAVVGSIGGGAVAVVLRERPFLVAATGAGVAYLVAVVALRAVGRKELSDLRHLVARS